MVRSIYPGAIWDYVIPLLNKDEGAPITLTSLPFASTSLGFPSVVSLPLPRAQEVLGCFSYHIRVIEPKIVAGMEALTSSCPPGFVV